MDELLNTAPCGFLSFADDGTITTVNATLLGMLGYERDELTGRGIETILTIGSRIFYQTHFFPLVRLHGSAEEIFLMLRAKGGEDLGVLCNVARRERGGRFANDCVFIRVRERQKYEDELLRAKRTAEHARSELEAQKAQLQQVNEQLEAQAAELELQHHQLQEQAVELETTSEELQTINDELLERTEELDHLRRVAEEANRAKSTFLAVMSHELRTPLNAIAGYTQLLEMGIHGPVTDAQREALGRIARSERHLLRLVNDVLNLSRIEAGRVDYLMEDVPLTVVLAGVMPMVEPQLGEKGLTFEAAVAPDLVVRADREKVQQILLNLLSNAIKFTPAGGRVTVDALRPAGEPDRVLLRVTDTGIGIPRENLATIFEPFVQVDVSPTGRSEGTGLGLAISRDLARGMGGELRVHSIEGEGSTFTLSLQGVGGAATAPGTRAARAEV
ncbi:MAG: PAS domain S-box protein [Gemmatimonadetes bacterium]|nr:PAS domain S-box protein [Gemmatimonadota bacterium]